MRYAYECADGHGLWSREPEKRCRAYVHGKPCRADLKQKAGPRPKK